MGYDYSISMEGVRAAECRLNNAAGRIARAGSELNYPQVETPGAMNITDRFTFSGSADIADALVEARQAKQMAQANLKVISLQDEISKTALDLIG